jgi:hypothetical protein
MIVNRIILITSPLFLSLLLSCSNCTEDDIEFGLYETEKKGIEIQDSLRGVEAYSHLNLLKNRSFELYNKTKSDGVSGVYYIIEGKKVENNIREMECEFKIRFYLQGRKIIGILRGTRISFTHPNDLYKGRYKSLWYTKRVE